MKTVLMTLRLLTLALVAVAAFSLLQPTSSKEQLTDNVCWTSPNQESCSSCCEAAFMSCITSGGVGCMDQWRACNRGCVVC
ncbi:MAG: hypothetical protein KTR30_25055 [Saprospiraceae bacterium]|nr:hypothetical protein [Saprospiraceae bacterium]